MKFLLKFVSCCRYPRPQEEVPEPLGRRQEETKSLVGHQRHHRTYNNNNNNNNNIMKTKKKKRGRATGSRAEWKPTLVSICENNVATVVEERVVKKKSNGSRNSSRDMASLAAIYEESKSRRNYLVTAMAAFSATSFLM